MFYSRKLTLLDAAVQSPRNASNHAKTPSFAWSSPSPTTASIPGGSMGVLRPQTGPTFRTITPDLAKFDPLTPTTTQFSQPLQPQNSLNQQPFQPQTGFNSPLQPQANYNPNPLQPPPTSSYPSIPNTQSQTNYTPNAFQPPPTTSYQSTSTIQSPPTSANWGAAASNPWNSNSSANPLSNLGNTMSNLSMNSQRPAMTTSTSSFSLPPPPGANSFATITPFKPPPQQTNYTSAFGAPAQAKPPTQKTGLDAYESLL
jgi:SCY1-like protein 2